MKLAVSSRLFRVALAAFAPLALTVPALAQSPNRAIWLNGVDAYGTAVGVGNLVTNSTWEAWVKVPGVPVTPGGLRPIVFRWGWQSNALFVDVVAKQTAVSMYSCVHACTTDKSAPGALEAEKWHHLAMVYGPESSPSCTVYLDGAPVASCGPQPSCTPADGWETILGAAGFTGYFDFLHATVDELRISSVPRYDGPFTPQHRFTSDGATLGLWHFDEGAGAIAMDSSAHGRHFTLQGGFAWVAGNPPSIVALSSTSGPQAGGQAVEVETTGFAQGPIVVRLGGVVVPGTLTQMGDAQAVSFITPEAATAGPATLRLTQGALEAVLEDAYDYKAPQIASATPFKGAWYVANLLTVPGANLAPNLPVSVTLGESGPLAGTFVDAQHVSVAVPAGFVQGAGPLDVTVTQGAVTATRLDGWVSLPALTIVANGSLATGGVVELRVESVQPGVAFFFVAASTSPFPLSFAGFHATLDLDPLTAVSLGFGGLLVQPTKSIPFPPGALPAGISVPVQAVVVELGALGDYFQFTNVATLTVN